MIWSSTFHILIHLKFNFYMMGSRYHFNSFPHCSQFPSINNYSPRYSVTFALGQVSKYVVGLDLGQLLCSLVFLSLFPCTSRSSPEPSVPWHLVEEGLVLLCLLQVPLDYSWPFVSSNKFKNQFVKFHKNLSGYW